MRADTRLIYGYEAPIHQALWRRICTLGAPRLWATLWLVICLYAGLVFLSVLGVRWVMVPGVLWALGQGVLMALTLWDERWDDLAVAQLTRRYKGFYHAG